MDITPYRSNVPQPALDDLHRRLTSTRWPAALPGDDWDYGVPTWYLKRLAAAWRDQFDWRGAEAKLNTYPQFTTAIDGTAVHFVHARSPHQNALPLLLTHGWPGSVFELLDIIKPLTEPDDPADAFHLVIPSLPGFGPSGPTAEPWDTNRIPEPGPRLCKGWATTGSACRAATSARPSRRR